MRRRRTARWGDGMDLITDALEAEQPADERPAIEDSYAFLVIRPDGAVLGFLPGFDRIAIDTAHAVGGVLASVATVADYSRGLTPPPPRSVLLWAEPGAEPTPLPPNVDLPVLVREVRGDGRGTWTVLFEYAAVRGAGLYPDIG